MKEFYEFHRLNDCHLAQLAGVSRNTIKKYWDKTLEEGERKLRVEIAIQIIEDYKLIWPPMTTVETCWVHSTGEYEMVDSFFKRAFDRIAAIEL